MAGSIIVSSITLDSDNNFSIKSNTGATLFFANTTGIDVANSIGATAITSDKILSVANTKISGNIISSQISPSVTLYGNPIVTGNLTLDSTATSKLYLSAANTVAIQTANTTALTISSAQIVNFANAPTVAGGAIVSAATPTALGTVYGQTLVSFSSQFFGYQAGTASATGANNTVAGYQAGLSLTAGNLNTLFGKQAGTAITSSSGNSIFGADSGKSFTTGNYNVAMGLEALRASSTSNENTAIGSYALQAATTGGANVAVGYNAGGATTTASNNVFVGKSAGQAVTTGGAYTFVGYQAGANVLNNGNVTAIGSNALLNCTTGSTNVACGDDAFRALTTAYSSTAIGQGAASVLTTGQWTIAVGSGTFPQLTTGDSNIAMGRAAGGTLTTGTNGIFIGRDALASSGGTNYENVFGAGTGKGSSTTFILNACYQGNNSSSWSTTSDRRLKKNIVDNNEGLNKLAQVQVRNFEYRTEEEVTELPTHSVIKKSGVQLGVIAQELQAVLPDCVKEESTGVLTVDSDNLTWYLINAVKELKAELDALKAKVA